MSEVRFPPGWDEDRVKRLLSRTEAMTAEEQVAEDEAAFDESDERTVISVPRTLLPAIRELLAKAKSA